MTEASSTPSHRRRVFFLLALMAGVFAGVVAVRTVRFTSRQVDVAPVEVTAAPGAARRLAGAVRIPTVTHEVPSPESEAALLVLHDYLRNAYPRVHDTLERGVVGGYSLLYTWPGRDPGLAPVVLTGHLDVVPADTAGMGSWTHPPFAGYDDGVYVWGRGAMDDRFTVLGLLEAVERLLGEGYRPRRTVYLAFGHDEERGGVEGAARIAALLRTRGVAPAFVLDEGFFVAEGLMPGLSGPIALVGVGEKGAVSLELSVEVGGGHASAPPGETAIGILSRAVARLEAEPMPPRLSAPVRQLFAYAGPEMGGLHRVVFANLWLFSPLVERKLAARPATRALIQTTAAPTIIQGGIKENLLPAAARAVVNFRILPGDSTAGVVAHVRRVIDDPRVHICRRDRSSEPSPVSDPAAPAFQVVQRAIRQVFPGVPVAPALMVARTDARHYGTLTPNVYRFVPLRVGPEDVARFHGADERVAVHNLYEGIQFYVQLIRNTDDL